MDVLSNLDLLSVGITIAAILILGFAVFLNDHKSVTARAFLFFAILTVAYGIVNYVNYQLASPRLVLWFLRFTLFFAVGHAFSFFHLFYVFPKEAVSFPRWYQWGVLPVVICTSILTLTPMVFSKIEVLADVGNVTNPIRGPGMPVFGMVVVGLVVSGFVLAILRIYRAKREERRAYRLILFGSSITFSLLIIFNFVLPVIFNQLQFIPLAPVFIFPFIAFTAYAIIKHRILNVKLISTEILTFFLAVVSLFEVILSKSTTTILYRSVIFILILGFCLLLIKSVRREIEEREEISRLADSLEKANARLKEIDRQKTEFLSIASHQLRTPLSIIKGYIELIQDGAYGKITGKTNKVLMDMDESNERLVRLVDEFLDVTRIEQGRTKFDFAMHDMNALITDVVKELKEKAKKTDITVVWEEVKGLPEVYMDDEKVRHVIYNFIDNGIKYTPKGQVTVNVNVEKNGLSLHVKDSGIGFDKEDDGKFFEKFYRGENVKTTNVAGTGLGIYVCKKFIETHKGFVWAKSVGLGKGSDFGFWIPLKATEKHGEIPEEPQKQATA